MLAELFLIFLALIFLSLGILLFMGKGAWLIAGYNTMSEEERKQYDERKLCKATSLLCFLCCIMFLVLAYLGYRVDVGLMSENDLLPISLIFVAAILITLVVSIRYVNKKAKK